MKQTADRKGREPKLMDFPRMRDLFAPHTATLREHVFINRELAVVYGHPQVFRLIVQQKPPFTINDYRLGIIGRGQLTANINLVEKRLTAGMLVFVGPGSILHPVSISPDLEIYGFGLSPDFPMPFGAEGSRQMPQAFNGQVRDFQLPVDERDLQTARRIVDLLWHVVRQTHYNRQTVSSLVAAQMYHYDGLYRQHADRLLAAQPWEQTLFDRFIYLVNRHSLHEHRLSFYASRMCLTDRYLGTVVRQASGVTAKEWIDRSLIAHAKIALRHTDKSVAQIAEELHFPNPSFFSKYFRRITHMTPLDYRNQ